MGVEMKEKLKVFRDHVTGKRSFNSGSRKQFEFEVKTTSFVAEREKEDPSRRTTKNKKYRIYSDAKGQDYIEDNQGILMKPALGNSDYWHVSEEEIYPWDSARVDSWFSDTKKNVDYNFDNWKIQLETNVMANIKQTTLVNGTDVDNLNAETLLQIISDEKAQLKKYKDMGLDSDYVNRQIKTIQENIEILINLLDSKE
jgi:hypothetical protein